MAISGKYLELLRIIALVIQLSSVVFGTVYFYKIKKIPVLKYFTALLWYIFLNELLGLFIRKYISDYNAIIYNIYYGISFSYLFILYKKSITRKNSKLLVTLFLFIYLSTYITNAFFENYLLQLQSIPYIIAALFLVTTIALYFIDIINSNTILHVKNSLLFWISVGLLLYYMGIIPFRIVRNYYTELASSSAMILVSFTATVIMNMCFIFGFIWGGKKQLS